MAGMLLSLVTSIGLARAQVEDGRNADHGWHGSHLDHGGHSGAGMSDAGGYGGDSGGGL